MIRLRPGEHIAAYSALMPFVPIALAWPANGPDALLVPLGLSPFYWLYWLGVAIWAVLATLTLRGGRWRGPMIGLGLIALTLLPSAGLLHACAQGNCL
jgi:hypothetical protein